MTNSRSTASLIAALALALAASTHAARERQDAAQEHLPRILSRDLPLIDRVLMLDATQKPIVELLLEQVEATDGSRESLAAFRADLVAVLTDAQRARLPEVWDVVYRERMESAGAIGGEAVDLGAMAQALLRGEKSEALDLAVAAYHKDLDPLLDARAKADPANGDALVRIRLEIRAVNDRSADAVAAALPKELADDFRRKVLAKGFPTAMAPSSAVASLGQLLDELPTDTLRALRDDAVQRYGALCARGVAVVRARDEARARDEQARADAARAVTETEREYDAFETGLLKKVIETATAEALQPTRAGKYILERVRANDGGADHAWEDSRATIQRFDKNGDGQIDGDEGTAALDAFTRSIGRTQRRKL